MLTLMAQKPGHVFTTEELAAKLKLPTLTPRRAEALVGGINEVLGDDTIAEVPRRGWKMTWYEDAPVTFELLRPSDQPRSEACADVLTRRALDRATLARQLLLERTTLGPLDAVHHLVGLQAQVPRDPYLALWSRLAASTPRPPDASSSSAGARAHRGDAGDDPPRHRRRLPPAAPAVPAGARRPSSRRHRDIAPHLRDVDLAAGAGSRRCAARRASRCDRRRPSVGRLEAEFPALDGAGDGLRRPQPARPRPGAATRVCGGAAARSR